MQFVVSEQFSRNSAVVHRCGCKQAQEQVRKERYVRVHGPFSSGEIAMSAAVRTGQRSVMACAACRP